MQQKGRKSVQSLTIVLLGRKPPPPPPAGLSEEATATWRAVTESLPPDYFRPSDLPLLEAYCTSAELAGKARGWLAKAFSPEAHRVHREALADLTRLARALRLCPSTRTRADSAALRQPELGERPWIDPAATTV